MKPCRVFDTRNFGNELVLQGQSTSEFPLLNYPCGIPFNAAAYSLNFTVVPSPNSLLFLTLWSHGGGAQPNASVLNALDGNVTSNLAIVPTMDGSVNAFASHFTHLTLDIAGYFAP